MSSDSPFEERLEDSEDPDAEFLNPEDIDEEYIFDNSAQAPEEDEAEGETDPDAEHGNEEEDDEMEAVELSEGLQTWTVHSDAVYSVAFHPNKPDILATGGGDDMAYMLQVGTESFRHKMEGHKDSIASVGFSKDGKYLAVASLDATVSIWDSEKGSKVTVFDGPGESVECFVWHDKGPVLFAGAGDGTGWLWNAQTKSTMNVLSGHGGPINDAVFTPDGKKIVTVSDDATLRVWDPKSGLCMQVIKGHKFHENPATSVSCYSDGNTCLSAGVDHDAYLSNINTGKSLGELKGHTESIEDTAFVPQFPWALTASMDGKIGIWDLKTLQNRLWISSAEQFGITRVQQFNTTVFGGNVRGGLHMWDTRIGGKAVRQWQAHSDAIMDLDVSCDGKLVSTVSDDGTVRVFSTTA